MLNQVNIMGRLVRDPEVRYTNSQIAVASFTLAVERDYTTKDGERPVDFIDCMAWRGTAEFLERYFSKGRMAVVSGQLQMRTWEDKDGNNRKSYEVVAQSVYFGDSKPKDTSGSGEQQQSFQTEYKKSSPVPAPVEGFSQLDDDIPF